MGYSEKNMFRVDPLLNIFALLITWPIAVMLVPETGYEAPGALMMPGLIMSIGLFAGIVSSAINSGPSAFRAEHILMLGIFYWVLLDAAQGAYGFHGISRESITTALNMVALFAIAIWGGVLVTSLFWKTQVSIDNRIIDKHYLFIAAIICFLLGTLRFVISCNFNPACLAESFIVARRAAAWYQTDLGSFDTLLHHFRLFGFLVLPLSIVILKLEGRVSYRVFVSFVLGLIIILFLIRNGGRREVGMVVSVTALVWLLYRNQISFKHFASMSVIGLILVLVMQAMIAWRYDGIVSSLLEGKSLEHRTRSGLVVDTNLLLMGRIIDLVPEYYPHTGTDGIYFALAAPIPRVLLPNKPRHRGFNLPQKLGQKTGANYTWTCSAIGDLYLIGGTLAVIIGGLLFGCLANFTSRLLITTVSARRRLFYSLAVMVLFLGLRALHDVVIYGMSILALWAVFYGSRLKFRDTRVQT